MKNADAWIKLLYTYGPFAILVLLVFVTEGKSRNAMKEAAAQSEKKMLGLFIGVYVLNWLAIFCLVIFSVVAWKQINLDKKPQISGTLENLSNSEILSTGFDDLYLRRIRQPNNSYSNYEWLLVNDKRLNDGDTIVFTIDRSEPEHEDSYDYYLPIRSDFYDKKVQLRREQDDLFFAGQEKPLHKRQKLIGAPKRAKSEHPLEFFTTIAYAQTDQKPFSADDFTVGLESPDVIVRRSARADLANQDQNVVLPWIDSVLKDGKSSYRLRLGVLVALNNMPSLPGESLMPATIAAIQNNLNDPDDALRNEALGLARKYKLIPVTVYEHINYSGKSQAYGPGIYRFDKSQLGNLPNDSASSVRVAKGFSVRLCEHEGNGRGSGACVVRGAGSYQLHGGPVSVADKVSFIQVFTLKKAPIV